MTLIIFLLHFSFACLIIGTGGRIIQAPPVPVSASFQQNKVTHQFNRRDDPYYEDHQIVCQGGMPPGNWHKGLLDGYEYQHPRQLCALPAYGGNPSMNAGFRCGKTMIGKPRLVFQVIGDNDDKINNRWTDIFAFCSIRCACLPWNTVFTGQRPALEVSRTEGNPPAPYEFSRSAFHLSRGAPEGHFSLPVVRIDEPTAVRRPENDAVLLGLEDEIVPMFCSGRLPPWPLPRPFNDIEYVINGAIRPGIDASSVCSSLWYRNGAPFGNAGLLCVAENGERRLRVRHDLAHPALSRFNRHQPHLGLAIELWCRRACTCDPDETERKNYKTSVLWMGDEDKSSRHYRSYAFFDEKGDVMTIPMLYFATGGENGNRPIPLTLFPTSASTNQLAASALRDVGSTSRYQSQSCGSECTSQQDCGATQKGGCRCVVTWHEPQKRLAEAAQFAARCFVMMSITKSRPRIGRRHLDPQVSVLSSVVGDELLCPCNVTFVARACCDAPDGIVQAPRLFAV